MVADTVTKNKIVAIANKLRSRSSRKSKISPYSALVIYILNALKHPVTKLKLQKLAFLAAIGGGMNDLLNDYLAYHYGMYSDTVAQEIENLVANGLAAEINGKFSPTPAGEAISEEAKETLQKSVKDATLLFETIEQYKDLTEDELLVLTYYLFPEFARNSEIRGRVERIRKRVALNLYKKGKISLLLAAKISGVPPQEIERLAAEG